MVRTLTKDTEDERQQMREEVLGTRIEHFRAFGEVLESVKENGIVKVLGSPGAIGEATRDKKDWLEITKVL
jgi:hypothetical protein